MKILKKMFFLMSVILASFSVNAVTIFDTEISSCVVNCKKEIRFDYSLHENTFLVLLEKMEISNLEKIIAESNENKLPVYSLINQDYLTPKNGAVITFSKNNLGVLATTDSRAHYLADSQFLLALVKYDEGENKDLVSSIVYDMGIAPSLLNPDQLMLNFKNGNHVYITEVPVPAAAWLFGSALLGLAKVRRKK